MRNALFTVMTFALLLASAAIAGEDPIKSAEDASARWLKLIDAGRYDESWDEASEMFKKSIGKAEWKKAIETARKPIGPLRNRKIRTSQYIVNPDGAPEGEYVMIQYDCSFEGLPNAVETLTPMKDKDGVWRVSGYYIK